MIKHTIELFILTAAAWPLIKVCISPPFWRTFPHLGVKAVCLLCDYAFFLVGMVLFFTQLLLPLAVVAAGVLLTLGWRALPGYGRRRGLPPGQLTLLPLGPWFDEQFFLNQAARYGQVFKTSYFFQPMVCIVGLPIGLDLLRRHDEK